MKNILEFLTAVEIIPPDNLAEKLAELFFVVQEALPQIEEFEISANALIRTPASVSSKIKKLIEEIETIRSSLDETKTKS